MKFQKYFLAFLIVIISCNTSYNKKLEITKIDKIFKNGSIEKAKEEIDKYLVKTKDNEYAWTLLGHIELDLDHFPLAIESYNKALKINKNTVEAITGLGIVSRKKGNYDEAVKYYNKAIAVDKDYAEAYSSLVTIYLKKKNFKEALKVGLKSYELNSESPVIASNLAVSYHYINDTINREKFFNIAKKNGYRNLKTLRGIFNGEYTIFD